MAKKMSLKMMEESFQQRLQDIEGTAEKILEEVQDLLEDYDSLIEERQKIEKKRRTRNGEVSVRKTG